MVTATQTELKILKEFRMKVMDLDLENATDVFMMRWLRARDMNITAAEEMLRKHLQWRKDEDMDQILEWIPPPNFNEDYPYTISGPDNDGHPILILPFGKWDVRKIFKNDKTALRAAWLRYTEQSFERIIAEMQEVSLALEREVTEYTFIVDFADLSMRQLASPSCVGALLEFARRFEVHYSDIVFQVYFLNVNRAFQVLFAMIKPFLSASTIGKIEIHSTPENWLPVLTSRFPGDQLPVEYRGVHQVSTL